MHISVEASLKKLRTNYIDILYVHWVSSVPHSRIGRDRLIRFSLVGLGHVRGRSHEWPAQPRDVREGSVPRKSTNLAPRIAHAALPQTAHCQHSQGISDTPAWIVSKANLYARLMGKTPFVIYQGAWSILQRDFERDIIPMARAEGTPPSYPYFQRSSSDCDLQASRSPRGTSSPRVASARTRKKSGAGKQGRTGGRSRARTGSARRTSASCARRSRTGSGRSARRASRRSRSRT